MDNWSLLRQSAVAVMTSSWPKPELWGILVLFNFAFKVFALVWMKLKKCLLGLQYLAISELEISGSCLPIIQMLKAFDKGTKSTSNDMQMDFGTNGQKVYQETPFSWPI